MPWTDPMTGRPLPRPSSADRRSKRRAQIRPIRTEGEVRADLARRAEFDSLRQLYDFVTTDPAEIVATAARVLGPARAAERANLDADLVNAREAVRLHRRVLPGQPVPDAVFDRQNAAFWALHAFDKQERRDRVIITKRSSAARARQVEAQRRRAAVVRRSCP